MRVPEKMSFEGLLSENRGGNSELLDTHDDIFSSQRRSRERTKISAVQRLVERRQAAQEEQRARSNSNNRKKEESRCSDYHRSLSANNNVNKTYISIGPGKPTRIRESSPVKKPSPEENVKVRRVSVPIQRSNPLFDNPSPLKSSRLVKSFTTEKSFEVNKDLRRRKHSVDVSSVIRRENSPSFRSSPESDRSETVAKRRISLQERFTARNTSTSNGGSKPPREPSPIPPRRAKILEINKKTETKTSSTTRSSNVFLNGSAPPSRRKQYPPAAPNRRFSQGNLRPPSNNNPSSSRKPPIAAPRKISLQNCHYPTTKAQDILSGNSRRTMLRSRRSTSPPSRILSPSDDTPSLSTLSGTGMEFFRKFVQRRRRHSIITQGPHCEECELRGACLIDRFLSDSLDDRNESSLSVYSLSDNSSCSFCLDLLSSSSSRTPPVRSWSSSSIISGSGLYFIRKVLQKGREDPQKDDSPSRHSGVKNNKDFNSVPLPYNPSRRGSYLPPQYIGCSPQSDPDEKAFLGESVAHLVDETFDSEDSELMSLDWKFQERLLKLRKRVDQSKVVLSSSVSKDSSSQCSTAICVPRRDTRGNKPCDLEYSSLGFRPVIGSMNLDRVIHFQNVTRRAVAAKESHSF